MSKKSFICPRCKNYFEGFAAISRKDNKTEICDKCGTEEALLVFVEWKHGGKE